MKKILIFITVIVLGIMAYTISSTYALYETNKNIDKQLQMAKWEINVNDIDAVKKNNIELQNINWNNNEHVKEGKVAPSMEGYYDIIIDPKNTDVAIKYANTLIPATNKRDNEIITINIFLLSFFIK